MDHILSATLELKDKFSAKIKSASSALKSFESENKKAGSAVKDTANCIKNGVTSLRNFAIAAGGLRVVSAAFSFLKSAYTGYAELDHALTKNKAIMGASAEETAKLKAQVLELGKTMPFTAREVAEAQKYQAMAGYKANDIIAMTPKLLKLSIASGEDLARTSDIMTGNLDAFGLKLSDADRLMDVMAATANNTNTSISMLGEAYTYVGAASRQFDSFEEVNVILGILANNGIKAGKAGRNLAAIYARLAKPTDDMIAEFAKTGTILYDTSGKFKGLRKIIAESKPALDRMTEAQRNQWLATVAGTEGLKVWASIAGYSAEGTKKVTDAIKNSTGAVEENYQTQKDTPQNKIKALESAWEGLKLAIADGASPAITEAIENITQKVNELTDSDTFSKENVESFFQSIKDGAETAIMVLKGVWFILKPIVAAMKALNWVGGKIGKAFAFVAGDHLTEEESKTYYDILKQKNRAFKMDSYDAASEEARKKLWIDAQKKEDSFLNSLYEKSNKEKKGDIVLKQFLYNNGSDGIKNMSEQDYEDLYYNVARGNTDYRKNRIILGQNKIPQIPNIPVPQLPSQNTKKEVNVNLHVNLSGTVMKETVDNKKIADELSKYLFKEYKTQSLLQM